jgi:hypothetical protein
MTYIALRIPLFKETKICFPYPNFCDIFSAVDGIIQFQVAVSSRLLSMCGRSVANSYFLVYQPLSERALV